MDTRPLISVIVPAYNMEQYLEKCIESIVNQTYHNLEIILIDDGSVDTTGLICDKYGEKDSRIMVIHQKNQGLAKSRKIGVHAASGQYIGFVDSDDWIDAGMYETLYQNMEKAGAQIVTSGFIKEFTNGPSAYDAGFLQAGVYHPKEDAFFCQNMIYSQGQLWGISPNFWNKLFAKDALLPFLLRVDDRITQGEDDACVYPCMAFADTVCVTNTCLYHYRMREQSMSRTGDDRYFFGVNLLYLTLKESFASHPLAPYLIKELDAYMAHFAIRGINGLWGIHLENMVPEFCFDCERLDTVNGTVLYGAGGVGRNCYFQLMLLNLHRNILWVDRNFSELQKQGLPVHSPLEILKKPLSPIIVAVQTPGLFESIREDLIGMGIDTQRIFWRAPIPFYKRAAGCESGSKR